jgi:hypothetical protein
VHDGALLDDSELLGGVSGMVLAGSRHERLTADLGRAMTDLEESRRRIAEAADLERARIERNLHDGAQQRLVSLRIRLGLAEERLKTDPGAGTQLAKELGFEAEAALDELRALARGVYPPVLTDRGVPDALRSVAMLVPLPVYLIEGGVTRHPIEIESAASSPASKQYRTPSSTHTAPPGSGSSSVRPPSGFTSRSATTGLASKPTASTDGACATCATASRPSAVRFQSSRSRATARELPARSRCADPAARAPARNLRSSRV